MFLDEKGRYLQIQIYQPVNGEMLEVPFGRLETEQTTVFVVKDMSLDELKERLVSDITKHLQDIKLL